MQAQAAAAGCDTRDYSTTILAAVISSEASSFLQIGDGAIVTDDPDMEEEYCWVFWPEESEYANVTYFATAADAEHHIQAATMSQPVREVAIFTDGLQRLALHIATRTAHAPFFKAMLKPLRAEETGFSDKYGRSIIEFLSSEAVIERTDDDKSLTLATCKSGGD